MKRKLDEDDVPTPVVAQPTSENSTKGFEGLGLDTRLLQAIAQAGFKNPTAVQAQAIPLALEGKDILARSKTGSGKTAAYILPILQRILREKATNPKLEAVSALILVPTRELANQVSKAFTSFAAYCAKDIVTINLTQKVPDEVQRSMLADLPDVVVATPARTLLNLSASALSLEFLKSLVIDEADLVLSYGYEEDLQAVAKAVPSGVQTHLMSATLSTEVDTLKGLFCRDPVVLALDEAEEGSTGVQQYVVKCAEDEKFLLIYVIFKLKLIKGKCIVFVGDIDRCYRLKLFLEQFGVRSCILNSELPVNSRIHVVEEFNKGVYDIIIASDEHEVLGSETVHRKKKGASTNEDEPPTQNEEAAEATQDTKDQNSDPEDISSKPTKKQKRKPSKRDKEYGISRGIDFHAVACVLNFDLPTNAISYTHRIGRTARAGRSGMALSFVIPSTLYRKHKPTSLPSTEHDEKVLMEILESEKEKGNEVRDYVFDMKQVDAFRYRMNDALRAVTAVAVREARTREIRQELLKSEKLKRHFEENPDHLRHLRHDGELRAARTQAHLRHVPEYLLPQGVGGVAKEGLNGGFVGFRKAEGEENRRRKIRALKNKKGKGRVANRGRQGDVLKTFNAKGRGKK